MCEGVCIRHGRKKNRAGDESRKNKQNCTPVTAVIRKLEREENARLSAFSMIVIMNGREVPVFAPGTGGQGSRRKVLSMQKV